MVESPGQDVNITKSDAVSTLMQKVHNAEGKRKGKNSRLIGKLGLYNWIVGWQMHLLRWERNILLEGI